jgi:hypothetical protein
VTQNGARAGAAGDLSREELAERFKELEEQILVGDVTTFPDLLNGKKEICDFLRVRSWRTVKKLIEVEGLPIARLCGRWYGLRADITLWIRATITKKVERVACGTVEG